MVNEFELDRKTTHFDLFCKYYGIKGNGRFCFKSTVYANPTYGYSVHAIDFIVEEIKKDPDNFIRVMKDSL